MNLFGGSKRAITKKIIKNLTKEKYDTPLQTNQKDFCIRCSLIFKPSLCMCCVYMQYFFLSKHIFPEAASSRVL